MSSESKQQTQDPTLPESTEPLLEVIKEEPVLDDPPIQPLNQTQFVIKEEVPVPSPQSVPEVTLFCSLCLRPCTSGQVVEFSAEPSRDCLDVASGQEKLGLILDRPLELEQCGICRACWTMVETLADFRECCLKAAAWRERLSYGPDKESLAVGDGWLLKENVEALERTRKMVQEHVERMEIAEVDARNRQDTDVDRLPKVEPLEIDDQDWVEVDSSQVGFTDPDSPEDPSMNESTKDAPEIVEKVDFKAYSCKNCQRTFETKGGMLIHFQYCIKPARKKDSTRLFTCSICSANFTARRKLEHHHNLHLEMKPFECRKDNCNKRFRAEGTRKKHESVCNGSEVQEESSDDLTESLSSAIVEPQRETTIYSCSNCPRKYNTSRAFKRHMQICKGLEESPQLYTCTICTIEFPTDRHLDAHVNKHNGIKPYKCNRPNCGQHFYGKLQLWRHNQTCGREKPICTICGLQLSSKVNLRMHMKIHTKESFGCETCDKKFKTSKALKRHQVVHSDEQNHPCGVCGKVLKSTSVSRHMRIHTQEKPFSCTVCGQEFENKRLVKPHMESHHAGEN